MNDNDVRAALGKHWAASDVNDFATEHEIYRDEAILDYPQSGERIRGRHNIQASRTAQLYSKRFTVRRMQGTRPDLRRPALLRGQHHGIRGS